MKRFIFSLQVIFFASLTASCTNDNENITPNIPTIKSGGVIDVELGGPSEPNSVYIDLSTSKTTTVRRDTWEIGFYNGTENRVFLNASLLVTAAKTEFTDIDKVTRTSIFKVPIRVKYLKDLMKGVMEEKEIHGVEELLEGLTLGYSMYAPKDEGVYSFTDDKQGTLDGTAIGDILDIPEKAPVYIVSAGIKIPKKTATQGSISTTKGHEKGKISADRGFYKIKVFMQGTNYVMKYAKFDESTYKEVIITKDETHNLTAFSFLKGKPVEVEPPKKDFDMNFAGNFSFYGLKSSHMDGKEHYAGVTYSDYVLTNTLGGVGVYTVFIQKKAHPEDPKDATSIPTGAPSFDEFKKEDVEENKFIYDDRSVIGSSYRTVFGGKLRINNDRYYILKGAEGNRYKLLFTAFMDEKGERGHCQFKYELLQ